MKEIIEVKTISCDGISEFDEKVNNMISTGWQPYGNMLLRTYNNSRPEYFIMMAKYSNKEDKLCL